MRQAKRFYISGMVQGVGFRFFAERTAQRLDLAGYTKNLEDGSVEVYAIGETAKLLEMENELRKGPRMASVTEVSGEETEIDEEHAWSFSIKHD